MTTTDPPIHTYWNDHYIAAAKASYPAETKGHKLAVGWKLTRPDCTSHGGYYWGLVNGDHDAPQMHHVIPELWDDKNAGPCPSHDGDGFCLIPQGHPIREAMSGGVRFAQSVGHVLVYAADLAVGEAVKLRVPWVIQVDCFSPVEMVRLGGVSPYLSGADLSWANLYGSDLSGANLAGSNLSRSNLSRADLYGSNLSGSNLYGSNLSGAYLTGSNLSRSDLSGSNLYGSNLSGADLSGSHLAGANLSGSNLSGSDLAGADLYGSNLYGADLYGADLSRSNLSGSNLSGCRRGETATWPAGFDWRTAVAA